MNSLIEELNDTFPPIEISIPTRGAFYQPGVLAEGVDPNRIVVRTLGIMDEFKYRDPFLLASGKAIDHLIRHICGDQILAPEEMCEIDIETILLASRLASYGPTLRIKHTCEHLVDPEPPEAGSTPTTTGDEVPEKVLCGHINTVLIDLQQFILRYGPIDDDAQFEVLLPRVGQTVYLKPVPYRTTVEVMKNVVANRRKFDALEKKEAFVMDTADFAQYEDLVNMSVDLQIQTLLDCIYAVRTRSGLLVEDPMSIGAWIFELPNSDHDVIAKRISAVTEEFRKISLVPYECEKCHGHNEFNLQMNSEILFLVDSVDTPVPKTSSITPAKSKPTFRTPSRISPKRRSLSPAA